jgi:hypothetical protein
MLYVTLDGKMVAGTVVYMDGDVCHSVEGGVLDADPELVRQGINTIADWFTICWAQTQGARQLFMGSSHAWQANGPYQYKERWGARPVRRHRLYATWALQAGTLSMEHSRSLSEMGFLVEREGRHYRVLVSSGEPGADPASTAARVQDAAQDAAGKGLAGVLLLRPDGGREWVPGRAPEPGAVSRGGQGNEPGESIGRGRSGGQSARERRRQRRNGGREAAPRAPAGAADGSVAASAPDEPAAG